MHDPELVRQTLGRVYLVPSNPTWAEHFSHERQRLQGSLGAVVNELQHYGSTAVPGILAKPIIDMMAPVSSLERADAFDGSLAVAGYQKVDAGFCKRRFYRKEPRNGEPAFHLHLVVAPSWPIKDELLLRDWMIQHPEIAREYEALKLALAGAHAQDMPQYTQGKTSFLRRIVNDARLSQGLPAREDWEE